MANNRKLTSGRIKASIENTGRNPIIWQLQKQFEAEEKKFDAAIRCLNLPHFGESKEAYQARMNQGKYQKAQ